MFAAAATYTIRLWYIYFIISASIVPGMIIKLFSMILHFIDTDYVIKNADIILISGKMGVIQVIVYTFFISFTFVRIYNKFVIMQ